MKYAKQSTDALSDPITKYKYYLKYFSPWARSVQIPRKFFIAFK